MKITKLLKTDRALKGLLIGLLYHVQPVWAAVCTTAPECVQTGTEGFIGGDLNGVYILPSVPNPSSFDTTRFTTTSGYELWVSEDIRGVTAPSGDPFGLVEKMFFDGDSANNTQRMDVTFFSSITQENRFIKDTGEARFLETSQLNLNYVNFETKPTLHFFGTDNQINLIDSRVYFRTTPLFISNAPLTINVNDPLGNGTESSFFNFFGNMRPKQTTINIANGNTLTFENSGSLSPFASDSQKLNFSSPVTGNVDNGTLKFRYSNVYFNSTDFNFTNNATLDVFGSDTKVEFEKLSLATGSEMVLSNNTTVTASELRLGNALIDLESGAKVNADAVWVDGPTTLDGPGGNGAGINTEGFVLSAGTTFTQNSSKVAVSEDFLLRSGAVLDINDGEFSAKTTVGQGGTVNINTGGEFVIAGGFSSQKSATFNIDAAAFLRVAPNAELTLVPSLFVLNDGQLTVDGFLSGNGTIYDLTPTGNGLLRVTESGQIAPGNPRGNKIGTITFENAVNFDNFVSGGNPTNQNQYWADIDVVGGTATSDLLQFNDSNFDITNLTSIKVNTASAKTADELDGQFFTIISSVDAGSTGTLVTGGSYPTIVEGGDVPTLIDFDVVNISTNGKDDLTLVANKDYDNFLKHESIKPEHTLTTSATTTVDPGTGQATTKVVTFVPDKLGPTATTSSKTTKFLSDGNKVVTTVTVAPKTAGDKNFQQIIKTVVTTPTGTVVGQSTQTSDLKRPLTSGDAHKVVTTQTTSTASNIISTISSPAVNPPQNLTTAATTTIDSGTGQATTVVVTNLPDQTVQTAPQSTSTTQVDPSTGNTILTKVDVVPDPSAVGSHQQTISTTVTDSTGAVIDQTSQTTNLQPANSGAAQQIVTTHVTSTTGNIVRRSGSETKQGPATGSANLSGTANLLVNSANAGNLQSQAALNNLTNSQVASHLDSIHAEPYSSYITVSLEHSDAVMNTVLSHAAPDGVFGGGATQEVEGQQTGKRFWVDASYADGKVDGSGDLGDFGYSLSSLTIGQDKMDSGDRTLGAYFSFGTQKMNEHDSATQGFSSETYHFGLYLNQVNIGAWDLRGVLGYAFSDHESKRQVNLSTSSTIASADFNSHSAYAGVKGTITGYENNWVTLAPELGLSYIYYLQEAIKESGDANLSLSIDSTEAHAVVASAGLNARFASLSDTMSIYPFAFSRYEHDFYANDNNEHEIDAALVAHPDFKQSFVGQNRGEHAMVLGAGLGSVLSSALQINGGFDYSVSNHGSEWGAGFNLEYYW